MRRRSIPLVPVLFLLAACGSDAPGGWQGIVRDSAGITIIENRDAALWTPETRWSVSPSLSIGAAQGDSAYLFTRVTDLAVDRRGRLLVLDQATRPVRAFDASGRFEQWFGRPGEGPGELSAFASAVLIAPGDTVLIPDHVQRRLNVYSPAGEYVRSFAIPSRPGSQSWEPSAEGRLLFRGLAIGRDSSGNFETWDGLLALRDSASIDTLIAFDYPRSPLGAPGRPRVPLIVNAAFWTRLSDGRIAWSSLDRDHIRVHGPDGALQSILHHTAWQARAASSVDHEALVRLLERKLSLMGGDAASVPRLDLLQPEHLPAITALRSGPDGTLWVQQMGDVAGIDPFAVNASDRTGWLGGPHWFVFDAEGRYLGKIELPERFNLLRVTDDALYGVLKDQLDVEHVVRFTLHRQQ